MIKLLIQRKKEVNINKSKFNAPTLTEKGFEKETYDLYNSNTFKWAP